jgi:cytochrome d ubiquinol oxidase subunit I
LPVVAVLQTRWTRSGAPDLERMTKYWGNLYVINYALGIITGLVMEFQFGLNWSGLPHTVGNLFGAPLALETIIAFFAESTLLGLWILGWGRIPEKAHLALIWLVTLTAYFSTFFIMVANGFMQHPVGYATRNGTIVLKSWGALLTNSGMFYGLIHLVFGALTTGGFFIAGVSAYHLARNTGEKEFFRRSLWIGLILGGVASLATVGLGYAQYGYLKSAQPAKYATMTGKPVSGPAPPDWISTPLNVMLGIGIILVAVALAAVLFREQFLRSRIVLWGLVVLIPLPFLALVCGWLVREVGRQPWIVYGLVRTTQAASPASTAAVLLSLIAFSAIYIALAAVDYQLIARAAKRGPRDDIFGEIEVEVAA